MKPSPPSLIRLQRSPLTQLIARVLVLTLLSWSLPFDAALPPRAAATEGGREAPVGTVAGVLPITLYVNADASAACGGKAPCFTTIQGAIDAVAAGQRIEIQAGTYVEQLEIQRKNASARATEADRIVIEADPSAPPGSVLLRGRAARCEGGYAVEFARSKYVTLRGLTIVGAGGRGIGLRGGSLENTGIHLERNRIGRGGPRECNGGIDVGRGNPQTVIANNLIHGNGRNGIRFRDGRGGSYYVVGNTIARNAWSGIQIAHAAVVELVNNVVVGNGTAPGAAQTRVGVRRLKTSPSPASQVRLRGNLVCGNAGGELEGPLLDATDAGNLTPTGLEGPGVVASATCGDLAVLFRDADGADDEVETADDDFRLASGAAAIDAGVDPRLLGVPAPNVVLEADFDGANARPRDGDGDDAAEFDAGAHESAGGVQSSPTPTRTSTATPAPTPSASATPVPTDAPTATPAPTPEPTASAAPTIAPTASPEPTAEPTPTGPPEPCLQCTACDTGLAGICSAGRTFCDGPFAEAECRTTTEPRTESCGNAVDEDCDGEVDEGGVPEQLPTTPPQSGVFVEPLNTTIKFFNQGSAIGLAHGDFDQDGVVDLATAEDANVHDGRRVSITFGNGNGTFSEPTYLALAPQHAVPQSVLAHDFDRDGPLDLLVAMRELNEVYFYRGDGGGGFAAPVASSVGGQAHQIQTADLNCDGILDVATIVDATHVTVGFGNGDGTFAPTTSYLFNNNLADLALTDVNGDGHPDLVAGSHEYAPLTGIGVRLNDGAGQFGDLKHTAGYTLPDQFGNRGQVQVFGIQIADFDGDTVPDAVASTQGPTGCFTFMKGNGDGTFALPDYFDGLADRDPTWTCVGSGNLMRRYTENVAPDVDADGKPDVIFYWDENRVVVGIGRGDGTFEARAFAASPGSGFAGSQTYQRADGSGVLAAIVADLNGDCMLDLVTNHRQTNGAHGRQGVLLARAPGDFHAPRISPLLRDPTGDSGNQMERGVVAGDFDNDGNPDFAAGVGRAFFTVPGAGIGIDIWKGNGDGRGEALPITLNNFAGTGAAYLRTADFDQDGFLDFVFQGGDGPFGSRHSVSTVFGQGDFTFVDRQSAYSPRLDANEVHIRNIITTDLDGDEDPDVVALYDNGGWNKWFATFSNTGTRGPLQFVQEVEVGQGSNGRGIVAADFDGDDIPDLIAQDSGFADPQRVRLFKGNGDLTFQPGVTIWDWTAQGAAAAEDFAAADLDGDGDQDLVMAQYYHACAYVLLGHDDGTFDAPVCYPFWTSRTSRLAVDDFDVDGSLDIVAGVEDGGLMYLRGRGDGTFETTQMYAVGRANTQAVNVADFDRDGRPDLLWSYNDSNFGHSIVLSNSTGAVPTPTPAPTATLPPGVTHTPRPTPTPTPTPRPTGTPPEGLASLVVEPVGPIILAGETQQFTATGVLDDGTSVDLTAAVAWSSGTPAAASINPSGLATGLGSGGTSVITAAIGAISGTSTLTVGARVAGDGVDPVAEITSPAGNAEVTEPVDVVGTATDANFLEYELAIAPAGETTFTRIGGGAAPVANGVLGQLDPTLLVNDLYTLRLTVLDRGGNETTAEIVLQVVENMKIGDFTVGFTDLGIPLSGIPLAVRRVYDSRDKRRGDFGVGWRLEVQTLRVRANRVLGTGWVRNSAGINVVLTPTDAHKVSVTLPNGRVEEFDMVVSPTQAPFALDITTVTGFAPRSGTLGRLEALANPNLLIFNAGAEDELVDDLTFATYDPVRFRYTAADGSEFVVHRTNGVETVRDPNGNVLTFDGAGISHSSGKSVTLTRDALGRVTSLVDPAGGVQSYEYDANGDLVRHRDQAGNATEYRYDRRHGLLRIVDPLGRPVARNEYDAGGRLVAFTSASGTRIELTHNVGARTEVVTDVAGNASVMEYDAQGNVVRTVDPLGGVTLSTYDANGNQLTTTNPEGETITRTFDVRGNRLTETNAEAETTTWTYDARDRVTSVLDPDGGLSTYAYDARGNLLARTNPLGVTVESLTYDAAGNVRTRTDGAGGTSEIEYDALGNATARIDELGNRYEATYDALGNPLTHTDRRGRTTITNYDERSLFTGIRDPSGNASTFDYDAASRMSGMIDATGSVFERDLDAEGRDVGFRDPFGSASTREYDLRGNLVKVADAAGNQTVHEYDALSRRTRTVLPDGATETYEHDRVGRVVKLTNARGNATRYEYDDAGRTTRVTDALGGVTRFEYDGRGNLVRRTDPLGNELEFVYDAASRLVERVLPDGSSETYGFDGADRQTSVTDAAGRTKQLVHDAAGRLVTVVDAAGGETRFTYDGEGNLLTQTDANGHVTSHAYDANGRRIRTTSPSGSFETVEYDALNNPTALTDRNGATVVQGFDALGRQTTAAYPGGGTVERTYTASGKVATVTDERGTTSYAYDERDRVVLVTNPDGSSLAYTWDLAGNRTSTTSTPPGGLPRTTSYTYDPLDRLQSVVDPSGLVTGYTYDAIGNLARIDYPNGTATSFAYDAASRLATLEHLRGATVLERFDYSVDVVGDRTRVDALDGSFVTYGYDVLRRLVRAKRHDSGGAVVRDVAYTYDAVGNRLTETVDGGPAVVSVYDENDRLTALGTATFAYDGNGNTVSRTVGAQTTSYGYDFENRLVRSEDASGVTTYAYDVAGNRVRKASPAGTVNYLVDTAERDGLGRVIEEYADSGTPLASYVHGNQLISQERGGEPSFYHRDGANDVRLLTGAAGTVTDTYAYDPFGGEIASSGTTINDFRFAGEQLDPETGLYYLRARYYSPATGRFFSVDPFAGDPSDPTSLHRYLYAHGNPINFADPSGRLTTIQSAVLTSAIIGGLAAAFFAYVAGERDPLTLVGKAVIGGLFGAVSGLAGGVAAQAGARFLVSQVSVQWMKRGAPYLIVPLFKAAASTLVSFLQTVSEVAGRKIAGETGLPTPAEIVIGAGWTFVLTFIAEAAFMRGAIQQSINKAAADSVGEKLKGTAIGLREILKEGGGDVFTNAKAFARISKTVAGKLVSRVLDAVVKDLDSEFTERAFQNTTSVTAALRSLYEAFATTVLNKAPEAAHAH